MKPQKFLYGTQSQVTILNSALILIQQVLHSLESDIVTLSLSKCVFRLTVFLSLKIKGNKDEKNNNAKFNVGYCCWINFLSNKL